MKIINKVTHEIKDINITDCVSLTKYQKCCYDNKIDNIYEQFTISESVVSQILDEYLALNTDWITLENYVDWQHLEYNYRIIANVEQRDIISNTNPQFLVFLNEEPINPRYQIGEYWVVYLKSFVEGAQDWLISIGCKIENKPL